MTPVKSNPRYRCAYCRRISTKAAMERHERRCFRNPNRECDACRNTGIIEENRPFPHKDIQEECPYCAKFKAWKDYQNGESQTCKAIITFEECRFKPLPLPDNPIAAYEAEYGPIDDLPPHVAELVRKGLANG